MKTNFTWQKLDSIGLLKQSCYAIGLTENSGPESNETMQKPLYRITVCKLRQLYLLSLRFLGMQVEQVVKQTQFFNKRFSGCWETRWLHQLLAVYTIRYYCSNSRPKCWLKCRYIHWQLRQRFAQSPDVYEDRTYQGVCFKLAASITVLIYWGIVAVVLKSITKPQTVKLFWWIKLALI